jgi:hypothetical protein
VPRYMWSATTASEIQALERRTSCPEAGGLVVWACAAVESLHYLDDVDLQYDGSHSVLGSHRESTVDVAHARWATSTCFTALDLCAAAIGRCFCAVSGSKELALAQFDPARRRNHARRRSVPAIALAWVDSVLGDMDYSRVRDARNSLTHSKLNRHFTLVPGGTPVRLRLDVGSNSMPVREVIVLSKELGTRHVERFVCILPQL